MGNQPLKQGDKNHFYIKLIINIIAKEMEVQIEKEFKKYAKNGKINREEFNNALSILQNYGFKRLANTPLADRLFFTFDYVYFQKKFHE